MALRFSRRDALKGMGGLGLPLLARVIGLGGLSALAASGAATAQEAKPKWCPSPWGPADERGATNRITPAKVQEAAKLIRQGKIYELGRVYERDMPLFGTRHFSLTIPQTYGPAGDNKVTWLDELVSAEIGQVGTQLDGLGHIGEGDLFYSRVPQAHLATLSRWYERTREAGAPGIVVESQTLHRWGLARRRAVPGGP
jgi:hypothetical protein